MAVTCDLPPSGFTRTITEVHEWADAVVTAARKHLSGPVSVHLWAYRHGLHQTLSCDLFDNFGGVYCVGLHAADQYVLTAAHPQDAEAMVPDLVDATHIAGIIIRALDAAVSVGRYVNEVNEAVLAQPLGPGHTNGPMAIAGKQT